MARFKLAAVWPQGQVGWRQSRLWECTELGKGFNARLFSWSPRNSFLSLLFHLGPPLKGHRGDLGLLAEEQHSDRPGTLPLSTLAWELQRLLGSCQPVLLFGDGPWAGKEVKEVLRAGRL